jgi:uncharacterized RDD family membrane protein YckC
METTPSPDPMLDPELHAGLDPMDVADTAYAKADLVKRFLAMLIDALIAGAMAVVLGIGGTTLYGLGMLAGAAYILVRDGLELDFADGRSIGKKVMKLRPVRLDGGAMDMNTSIRRNWTLALGNLVWGLAAMAGGLYAFAIAGLLGILAYVASLLGLVEGILVLVDKDGRRIGDKMAATQVIETNE